MKVDIDEGRDANELQRLPPELRRTGVAMRVVRRLLLVVFTLAIVAAVVISGILPRVKAKKQLEAETKELATRVVNVTRPKRATPAQEVILPASIQAYTEAPIYARTNGYLKRWTADIGARVKTGQLLAEIDTPEIDQQLRQARADLATAEANFKLAEITAKRYEELLKTNSVAQQDADNAAGNFDAKRAAVESARASVSRLEELESFSKIYAPFDGVITARNTDVGALIDSGSGGGPQRELFHIAMTKKLRVYVNIPQAYSQASKPGLRASITLADFPGRSFSGLLVRTSNAIDPSSRTLLSEIDLDNPGDTILPGAYGEVHLKLPSVTPTYLLPVNTLLFRSEGLRIATVQYGKRIVLLPITLGRDFGTEVEVVSGLTGEEAVVLNPPDSLANGETVQVSRSAEKEKKQ